jgi:hypothetical protein
LLKEAKYTIITSNSALNFMGRIAKKIKDKYVKRFFSSDSYDRNLELMKLLTTEKNFKKIVAEARVRLKIPPKGLEPGDKARRDWYDWLVNESDKVFETKSYWDEKKAIRKQLDQRVIGLRESMELEKKLNDRMPLNYFGTVAKNVCKKFNLPNHFAEFVQKYILTNEIDAPQHNYAGGEYEPWQLPWEAGFLPINIYTRLTKDEWEELKHYVDDRAKAWNLPRHSRIPKIDKYVEAEQILEEKQIDHVTGKEYELTHAEAADVLFGDVAKKDKVRDMIRKLGKLQKIRFTRKERGKK